MTAGNNFSSWAQFGRACSICQHKQASECCLVLWWNATNESESI